MSADEQINATGQLVTDAAESKKRLALLRSKAEGLSDALASASQFVNGRIEGVDHPGFEDAIARIPTPAAIRNACAEHDAEKRRFEQLRSRVATLGLQI